MAEINLSLSAEEMHRILGFLGYGKPSAPVWFIGIEEGLGKANSQEAVSNLKSRTVFLPVMDLREAHTHLEEKGKLIDIETMETFTPVWEWMGKIMRAYHGFGDWPNIVLARDYVRHRLGRCNGETFLTELSPIPSKKKKIKAWIDWFAKQDPELKHKLGRRKERLKQTLAQYDPPLVICYGNGGKQPDMYADLLGIKWRSACPKVSASEDGRRLLVPFLGVGQITHELIQNVIDQGLLNPF